jgi:hypothetical protein
MNQSELFELKQKIHDAIQSYFGAAGNGPSFTHRFDEIFAAAFQKLEAAQPPPQQEQEHGDNQPQGTEAGQP